MLSRHSMFPLHISNLTVFYTYMETHLILTVLLWYTKWQMPRLFLSVYVVRFDVWWRNEGAVGMHLVFILFCLMAMYGQNMGLICVWWTCCCVQCAAELFGFLIWVRASCICRLKQLPFKSIWEILYCTQPAQASFLVIPWKGQYALNLHSISIILSL